MNGRTTILLFFKIVFLATFHFEKVNTDDLYITSVAAAAAAVQVSLQPILKSN